MTHQTVPRFLKRAVVLLEGSVASGEVRRTSGEVRGIVGDLIIALKSQTAEIPGGWICVWGSQDFCHKSAGEPRIVLLGPLGSLDIKLLLYSHDIVCTYAIHGMLSKLEFPQSAL